MSMLFTPIKLRKKEIKNRLSKTASGETCASKDGFITDDYVNWYKKFARGGLGLIHSGAVYTRESGKIVPFQPGLDNDDKIPGFRKTAEEVHKYDCLFLAQLNHPGRHLVPGPGLIPGKDIKDIEVVAPSPVRSRATMIMPRELTTAEIEEIIQSFTDAGCRAEEAGLDGVEIHGAHGFLISSFISMRTNKRTDKFGGSLENRLRVFREIVEGIRKKTDDGFIITAKLNWTDGPFPKGITTRQLVDMVQMINNMDVDAIEISSGSNEWLSFERGKLPIRYMLRYGMTSHLPLSIKLSFALSKYFLEAVFRYYEGFNMEGVQAIKKIAKKPVICTGGFKTGEVMEGILQRGEGDIFGLARQLICDPELPNKLRENRANDVVKCSYCNKCVAFVGSKPTECYENEDFRKFSPPSDPGIK
ncbi:MAG: NADH:flavin oxidoreductase [Deltaproteobacteria bacterium]|nr:MAG: NADH:flavin oxidoreductase [Deltaproteobacteria bacterium]